MTQSTQPKPDEVVFETVVGNIKAMIFRRQFKDVWMHTLSVFRCYEPDQYWSLDNCFFTADIPDAIEAMVLASRWLKKHSICYTMR